jgi:hypothetical protein
MNLDLVPAVCFVFYFILFIISCLPLDTFFILAECVEYSMKTFERFTVYHRLKAPPDISPLLSLETITLKGLMVNGV